MKMEGGREVSLSVYFPSPFLWCCQCDDCHTNTFESGRSPQHWSGYRSSSWWGMFTQSIETLLANESSDQVQSDSVLHILNK